MTIKIKTLFNVSQLYSIPRFLRINFRMLIVRNEIYYHEGEEKRDLRFFDRVSCRILSKKYKNLQQKVDQWLVFA